MPPDVIETRDRILDAATDEFCAHGFAGARVDAIAKAAGCNKQLIYHYFGNKSGLYEAVAQRVLTSRRPAVVSTDAELQDSLGHMMEDFASKKSWWRLLMWEALEVGEGPVVGEEQRRIEASRHVGGLEHAQRIGMVDARFDTKLLLCALTGMILFPFILPQIARLMTGCSPYDPAFRARYTDLILQILRRMAPEPR